MPATKALLKDNDNGQTRMRKWMTLVAGFRCRNGGILLCADREETDGYSKRPVDKIYRISHSQCQVFIAGSGATSIIAKACEAIHESFLQAASNGIDLVAEHKDLLESALKSVYEKYVHIHQNYYDYEIGLIIVVAPMLQSSEPLLYKTESSMLVSQYLYATEGSGKTIADYLTDRLYKHGITRSALAVLAAFIFRESEDSTVGVGSGMDMVFIFDGDRSFQYVGDNMIHELKSCIPTLQTAIYSCWQSQPTVPETLVKNLDVPLPPST